VVEVISGSSISDFFAERIFGPLGMVDTGYWVTEEKLPRVAALYGPDMSTEKAVPSPAPDRAVSTKPTTYCGGGHGLLSTAGDYHRFAEMLRRGGELDGVRLLSPTTVELMTSNHLPGGADIATYGRPVPPEGPFDGIGFGLGLSVLLDPAAAKYPGTAGTFGWGGAATTEFFVDPARELTVAYYTQFLPPNGPLRRQLRQMTYQAVVD
jgi:CubicO group peptidase (beta-lactamase class C family)